MKKEKFLQLLGDIAMTAILIGVGSLIVITTGTLLYQMVAAMFE